MEKDKLRSVITVGALACSVLILSALFIGCEKPGTPQQLLGGAQLKCPHSTQAAYYHHTYTIPPHRTGYATVPWYVTPPPMGDTTGLPAAQPCPVDTTMCRADSVKCTACGAKLYPSQP